MGISALGFNFAQNVKSSMTNPVRKITGQIGNTGLVPLKQDVVQISSETKKFIDKLDREFPREAIKVDGKDYTKFRFSRYGSNPAFWAIDNKSGELYYIKYSENNANTDHLKEEVLATNLYKLAGFQAPDMEMCTLEGGIKGIKSKYTPGLKDIEIRKSVHDGYAADAWLANWDSLLNGNTMLKDGKTYKIDNGGALRYRAQGALKPNFSDKVDEVMTLINGRNRISSSVYNGMTKDELIDSFNRVCRIKDGDIKKVVKDKELAQTLINRKDYMNDLLDKIVQIPYTQNNLYGYMQTVV